jgi:hypothetical protein
MTITLSQFLHVGSTFSDVVHCHGEEDSGGTLWVVKDHMFTQVLGIRTHHVVGKDVWMTQSIKHVQKDPGCPQVLDEDREYTRCEQLQHTPTSAWTFTFDDVHDFIRHVCNLAVVSSPVHVTVDPVAQMVQFDTTSDLGSLVQRYPITLTQHAAEVGQTTISIRCVKTILSFLHSNTPLPVFCHLSTMGLLLSVDNISLLLESC